MENTSSNTIGYVIRILDQHTLIINVGKSVLNVGDKIKIYEILDMLYDLDGKEICPFEHTKDILTVMDTDDKYSVCKKTLTQKAPNPFKLSPLFEDRTELVPLNVSKDDIKPFSNSSSIIHVGDLVKLA